MSDLELPVLETARLRIRPYSTQDVADAHHLYTSIGWVDSNHTVAEQLESRRRYVQWNTLNHGALAELSQPPYGDRAVELRASGVFVGACGIAANWLPLEQLPYFGGTPKALYRPEVSLMWAILPEHQRNGYATEVAMALVDLLFSRFHLHRVIATTTFENLASQKVMLKLGMRLERNTFPDPPWLQMVGILENGDETV